MAERITIRELVVSMVFEGRESGILRFNAALQSLIGVAQIAERAIGVVTDTVIGQTIAMAELGDETAKAARKAQVSVGVYDALGQAIKFSGGTVSDLNIGLKTLTRNAETFARTGKGEAAEALQALLGPDAREVIRNAESIDQLLPAIAEGFSRIEDPIKLGAFAQRAFGESGSNLIPLLEGGAAGLQLLYEEAELAGQVTRQFAEDSESLADNLLRLDLRLRGLSLAVRGAAIPALDDMVEELSGLIDDLREAFGPEIQAAGESLADLFRLMRDVIRALRGDSAELRQEFAVLRTALTLLSVILGLLVLQRLPLLIAYLQLTALTSGIAAAKVIAAWAAAAAPFIALASLITGILLVLEDLIVFIEGGNSAFGQMLAQMEEAGGNVAALAKALRFLFGGGLGNALFDAFEDIRDSATDIITDIEDAILAIPRALQDALASLTGNFADIRGALAQGFGAVPDAFASAGAALTGGGTTNNIQIAGISSSVSLQGGEDARAALVAGARANEEAQSRMAAELTRQLANAMEY